MLFSPNCEDDTSDAEKCRQECERQEGRQSVAAESAVVVVIVIVASSIWKNMARTYCTYSGKSRVFWDNFLIKKRVGRGIIVYIMKRNLGYNIKIFTYNV